MCGPKAQGGRCQQNSAIPLICPLDIQGACESSVFGDIIKQSKSTSNTGLLNINWRAQREGSSLLLGMFLGFLIKIIIQFLIKYIKNKKQKGKWPRGLQMTMPWWGQTPASPLQQPMIPASPPPVPAPAPMVQQNTMALSPASPQVQFAPQHPGVQPQPLPLPPLLGL